MRLNCFQLKLLMVNFLIIGGALNLIRASSSQQPRSNDAAIISKKLPASMAQPAMQKSGIVLANSQNITSFMGDTSIIGQMVTPQAPSVSNSGSGAGGTGTSGAGIQSNDLQQQQASLMNQLGSTSLAAGEDPVTHLDYSSIGDEILRKKTANFIYFNANFSLCRHCHKFLSIWKELAQDIRWWRQVVRLFAINCSEEDNIDVCRRAGVTQFPQVKFYWVMSQSLEQDGQRLRILGKSAHAMRHLITDKLLDNYMEHNKLLAQRGLSVPASFGANTLASSPLALPPGGPLGAMMGQLMSGGNLAVNNLASMISSTVPKILPTGGSSGALAGLMNGIGGLPVIGQLFSSFLGGSSGGGGLGDLLARRQLQPLASNWPEMEPLEAENSNQLLSQLPLISAGFQNKGEYTCALLIMETQEYLYTGLEVILDLSFYSNQTYISRVRDERSQLTRNLTKRDDILAPALIYVSSNREPRFIMAAPKYSNDEDLRRIFVRSFERRYIKYPVKRVWYSQINQQVSGQTGSETQEDEEVMKRLHQVYMADLINAIRASLTDQVYRHSDLSDDQYNALVRYVYILINYFPFASEDPGLKFLKRLHVWLQNQVSPIDVSEYKKQFHDVDEYLGKRDYIACRSLSSSKSIPSIKRHSSSLFTNPAQLGKVVSNITRLFRGQHSQASHLRNFLSALTTGSGLQQIIPLGGSVQERNQPIGQSGARANNSNNMAPSQAISSSSTSARPNLLEKENHHDDSPLERIIKSLTSGSLGSDSSILRLISSALTGASEASGQAGKSSKFAREYPCAIWKLAHVLVVNEYVKDSPRKDVRHIVIHSLHQYVLHFFACSTCGNRVKDVSSEFKMNSMLSDHLQDQGDSILLLWKLHNRVNKRLESELRQGSPPKIQFPSDQLCSKCRTARNQLATTEMAAAPNWHEKQLVQFLVHHYRWQSIIVGTDSSSSSSSSSSINPNQSGGIHTDLVAIGWRLLLGLFLTNHLVMAPHYWSQSRLTQNVRNRLM